jgi:hypothetical protein
MCKASLVLALLLSAFACSNSLHGPDNQQCGLGPISLPGLSTTCSRVAPGCPATRPRGARTLVGLTACNFRTGTAPCAISASVCPLVEEIRAPIYFQMSGSDYEICPSSAAVTLTPLGEGGILVEWTAQARDRGEVGCRLLGPQYQGITIVAGPCCAETFDIVLPEVGNTLRLRVQSDWSN